MNLQKEETVTCRCSDCGGNEDKIFKQKTYINQWPKGLIIQLGRFASLVQDQKWWSNKINHQVTFPVTNLDVSYMSELHQGPIIYDLLAVAVSHIIILYYIISYHIIILYHHII
jgi:ubiquitin C-terminal hydrolase